jgi:enoyl-CoA hydratase/carnithine racemase
MEPLVLTEQRGAIFEIALNRPQKRNAISLEMYDQLDGAIRQAGQSSGVRAVLIRGQGEAFSSGIDVTTFLQLPARYGDNWQKRMPEITADYQLVLNRLESLELPTIALIHGYCLGLAMELALACDIRLAAEGAIMGLPETRLGIIPDAGGTTRLTRLVGPGRAKELILTGRRIDSALADQWGIVNHVVPAGQLMSEAESLVEEITKAAPLAVGLAKRVIDGMADQERGLTLEAWAQSQLIHSEDFAEAVQSFVAKRKPNFKGR